MRKINPLMLAWAAGFIDGEGTFNINIIKRPTRNAFTQYFGASQVRVEPLKILVELFGGTLHQYSHKGKTKGQDYWVWRLGGAEKILYAVRLLLPYLVVKREEALMMEQWCENLLEKGRPGRPGHTEEENNYRCAMVQTMMALR